MEICQDPTKGGLELELLVAAPGTDRRSKGIQLSCSHVILGKLLGISVLHH